MQPLDQTTVAVTDFTEAGRQQAVPSAQAPIYYVGVNAGLRNYLGAAIAGDTPPEEKVMLRVIAQVLTEQGYRPADTKHPATQVIVCSWGTLGVGGLGANLGPGPALGFLGGGKMGLGSEIQEVPGHIDFETVLARRFRSGQAETVLHLSRSNLYGVLLRAYDLPAAGKGKIVQLWETRLACPTPRTDFAALPQLVVSGRRAIGRETELPVVANMARTREAWVELPEAQVIEYIDATELTKARQNLPARANRPQK